MTSSSRMVAGTRDATCSTTFYGVSTLVPGLAAVSRMISAMFVSEAGWNGSPPVKPHPIIAGSQVHQAPFGKHALQVAGLQMG
jgi:hypothetical protein